MGPKTSWSNTKGEESGAGAGDNPVTEVGMQRALTAFMCLLLQCSVAQAQWASVSTPGVPRLPDGRPNLAAPAPRTADGKPDLAGIWAVECGIYGRDACFTQSLFFDLARNLKPGDVEMTPWAASIQAQREKRNHVDDPYGYCLPPGVPRIDFGGGPFKILQTPKATAILYETLVGLIFRQVFTDGRALPSSAEPTWLGYSVGRWDGDTFAVETTGFKDGGWLDTLKATPCASRSASAARTPATWSSPSRSTIPRPFASRGRSQRR